MKKLGDKKLIKRGTLIFVFILLFFAIIFRHSLLTSWIVNATARTTGLRVFIEDLDLDIFHSRIYLRNVTLFNAQEFDEHEILSNAREIFIQYNLFSWLTGRAPFEYVKADIRELNIVRNNKGQLNVLELRKDSATSEKKGGYAKLCSMPVLGYTAGNAINGEQGHSTVFSLRPELAEGSSRTIDVSNSCKTEREFVIKRLEILLERARFIDYKTQNDAAREIILTTERPCIFKNVGSLGGVFDTLLTRSLQ